MNPEKTGGASSPSPLVAIVGPTASGKSALGIAVAREFGGEVVVCDSTQIYRHFNIGTAKVRKEEQCGVPHHLVNLLEPEEVFTAGDYRKAAIIVLDNLRHRNILPVFTVGTGLYLRALLEGLADIPLRSEDMRESLRRRAATRAPGYLHRLLKKLDAAAAARIAAQDTPKLIRAIEVCLLAAKPITELHRSGRAQLEGYSVVKVGLLPPRAALNERIERRVGVMLDAGWLDEVRSLASRGIAVDAKPFQFIGYGELRSHLEGKITLADAVSAIQQATRRYAKRQITWFRKEPAVEWFAGFGDDPAITSAVLNHIRGRLHGPTHGRTTLSTGV